MNTETILYLIVYILLGLHSVYFLVKRVTLYSEIRLSLGEILFLVLAFLLPVIFHLIVYVNFPHPNKKPRILFKKREE
jgi:hypothetical protein